MSEYTETLKEYLENNGGDFPVAIKNLLNQIPNFVFKDTEYDIDITLNFIDLFKEKYDIREICAETEQLFEHFLTETAQHCLVEYVPKIYMWLKHFKELFKFTVTLDYGFNQSGSSSSNNDNSYYLNPITKTSDLKLENVDKSNNSSENEKELTGHKDVLQSVWGKTRAALLEQVMDLKSVYTDCLDYFQRCFMAVY